MKLVPHANRCLRLEALEPRALLAADAMAMPYTLYYPEGYSTDRISEFVPITNPNDTPVQYQLLARYETGERDQVIAEGTIPANTRGGVTVSTATNPGARLVRRDSAYALELRSTAPVDATISHYDFGATIGQAFTTTPSTMWSFTNVQKDHAHVRDFLVYFNTSDAEAHLTITFIPQSGSNIVLNTTLGAQRRGGLNIDATRVIPAGTYAVTITSDQPIVAALSHYDVSHRRGFGVLGAANGGALAGLIPSLDFQDNDRGNGNDPDHDDDDNPGDGGNTALPTETSINILNTTAASATVKLTFLPHAGTSTLTDATRTVTVPGGSRVSIAFTNLSFALDDNVGVAFQSDQIVTVAAVITGPHRAAAIPAIVVAATQWGFGEGFMTPLRAGITINEDLFLFNPAATQATVNVEFLFVDGTTTSTTVTVAPLAINDVVLDQMPALIDHCDHRFFFGIRVTGAAPMVATLDHLDRILRGGFTTAGIPQGTVVQLSSVLVIPAAPQPVPTG